MLRLSKFLRYSPYECQVPIIVHRHFVTREKKNKISLKTKTNKKKCGFFFRS